jgi:hypothetical protein
MQVWDLPMTLVVMHLFRPSHIQVGSWWNHRAYGKHLWLCPQMAIGMFGMNKHRVGIS